MVEHAVPEVEVADNGFTVDDWLAWDGVGDLRVELIDGTYVVNPAPVPRHQRVVNRLLASLAVPLEEAGLTAEISGGGVVLPGADPAHGLIPDVMAVRSDVDIDELSVLDAGEVVLAVEVLSRSSRRRDLADKLRIYAEMGIPHYWIVDPSAPVTVTTHVLDDGAYRRAASASGDEPLVVREPLKVTLTPSALARKREA